MAHFYDTTGAPQHTVLNKAQTKLQGKDVFRPATIADARRNNWFSGWTAIGSIAGNMEWLYSWRKTEMWKVILEHPFNPDSIEEPNDYRNRINKLLKIEMEKAAKLGTKVHELIELLLTSDADLIHLGEYSDMLAGPCRSFHEWYDKEVGEVVASEQTFCSPDWGFGGAVDLQYLDKQGRYCIVDFKTKRTKPGEKIVQGLGQRRQLVAYALGLGKLFGDTEPDKYGEYGCWGKRAVGASPAQYPLPLLGNLYLSTTEPNRWEYHTVDPAEIPELILDVRDCARLWQRENNFGPYAKEKK